jgi:hypothetical protein
MALLEIRVTHTFVDQNMESVAAQSMTPTAAEHHHT